MKNVGIIGAGAMGSGIAQVAATAGHSVVLFDTNAEALSLSKSKLASVMGRLVEKGRLRSCLLYTSPSPRDLRLSRMPSSA